MRLEPVGTDPYLSFNIFSGNSVPSNKYSSSSHGLVPVAKAIRYNSLAFNCEFSFVDNCVSLCLLTPIFLATSDLLIECFLKNSPSFVVIVNILFTLIYIIMTYMLKIITYYFDIVNILFTIVYELFT